MRLSILPICTIILLSVSGCKIASDSSSPIKYEKENISFSYPQDWKVTEDVIKQDIRYLLVEGPDEAIFAAQIYPKKDAVSLNEFVEWFSSKSREETPIGNIGKSSFYVVERNIDSSNKKGIKENFSIIYIGENIPHIREYYTTNSNSKSVFLIVQAATEDLSKVEPSFNLILGSFVVE